jgi:hypothetical protein
MRPGLSHAIARSKQSRAEQEKQEREAARQKKAEARKTARGGA